jgi:hypothetical protein
MAEDKSIEITYDWSELKIFNKKLRDKMFKEWMRVALEAYALTLEEMIVDEIERMNLQVDGWMKQSVTHEVTQKINTWLVEVGTKLRSADGYPYPVGVHEGTIAHTPPWAPIEEWVRKKINPPGNELKKVTGAVWTKIRKHGTEAHPFMQKVFRKSDATIRAEIGKELIIAMKGGKVVR